MPTRVSVSQTNKVLIFLSKFDELDKDGNTLTSRTHGFKLASIITSKPYNSKQLLRVVGFLLTLTIIWGSTAIKVFTIIAFIWLNDLEKFKPCL